MTIVVKHCANIYLSHIKKSFAFTLIYSDAKDSFYCINLSKISALPGTSLASKPSIKRVLS